MKNFLLVLVTMGLCAAARSESLTTSDGVTYNGITTRRVEPDGLYIEYMPAGGGMGMSKVKFARLSPEQQKQFGYDPDKARDFEARNAKAMEDWRAENARMEQAAKAELQARQALDVQEAKIAADREVALAQLKQGQVQAPPETGAAFGWTSYGGWGYAWVGVGHYHHEPTHRQNYKTGFRPIPITAGNRADANFQPTPAGMKRP